MKGLIPAAGLGTRLRPLTYTRPKPLLRVANRPIISYAIENLKQAGISDIGIVVSDPNWLDIEDLISEVSGVKITPIHQDEQLGIAHAVKSARKWLGDSDFCVYLGDNLFGEGIERYVKDFIENKGAAVVALVRVADPRSFGVANSENGRITKLVEKPKEPESDLAVAGIYCFSPIIHDVIENLLPSARGEYEITDAISGLIERGLEVRGVEVNGWWKDTGRPSDLLDANRLILEEMLINNREAPCDGQIIDSKLVGWVRTDKNAIIKNSKIIGPVLIGPGAIIEDSYIGPFTSVGAQAKLRKVEVEFSVIDEEATLEELSVRLQECLIGRRASVRGNNIVPRVHRLILSDTSSLELS